MSHPDIGFVNILFMVYLVVGNSRPIMFCFILLSRTHPLVFVVILHHVLMKVVVHHCMIILGTLANVVIALCILIYW